MTTEPKPPQSRGEPLYTVADLRRWARMLLANPNTDRYPCYGHSTTRIAQAAAFDALADGIEACDQRPTINPSPYDEGDQDARNVIGRILRGEKPK